MIKELIEIARKAGGEIMDVYSKDFSVETKDENDYESPLTEADIRANELIISELGKRFPLIPIISEENKIALYSERKSWSKFFLVDPLDGTKEFVNRNGEFTVNIAYVENGKVVLGVVFVPVSNTCYYSDGVKSFKRIDSTDYQIKVQPNHMPLRVVASRSYLSEETKEYVANIGKEHEFVSIGSSLKFCLVAEGVADIYPHLGSKMEWDVCAAHAVVKTAGGNVFDMSGNELIYGKEDLHTPFYVVKKV